MFSKSLINKAAVLQSFCVLYSRADHSTFADNNSAVVTILLSFVVQIWLSSELCDRQLRFILI